MAAIRVSCSPDCSSVAVIGGRETLPRICGARCERCVAIGEPPLSAVRAAREHRCYQYVERERRPRSIVVHDGECPHAEPSFSSMREMASQWRWLADLALQIARVVTIVLVICALARRLTGRAVLRLVRHLCRVGAGRLLLWRSVLRWVAVARGLPVAKVRCPSVFPHAQSPSLWWGGGTKAGQRTLIKRLMRGQRCLGQGDSVVSGWARAGDATPVARHCTALLGGGIVCGSSLSGGHDVAWWREGCAVLDRWCA